MLNGVRPSSTKDAIPSPSPPGPANRSTTPKVGDISLFLTTVVHVCITDHVAETRMVMTDIVDQTTRSRMMAGIKGKNTVPELALRQALHALGLRFRLHAKGIFGCPDIVLPKYRAVVFVHGCFWHRHEGCRYASMPSTRPDFWHAKFAANLERDKTVRVMLSTQGWRGRHSLGMRTSYTCFCSVGIPHRRRVASI